MTGRYDASGEANQPDLLAEAARGAAEQDLLDALDDLAELVAEVEAEEEAEELDPQLARLMDAVTGADDASLEFRSLHRRVAEGHLTWQQLWARPQEQAGGVELLSAIRAAQLAEVRRVVQEEQ